MRETRPNILLLMTDQQRYDSLGCTGCEAAHTPNLDRLAAQGALFEHAYVTNPICAPSRASLWTGRHLPGHGVYRLYDNLPDDQVLFSKSLQQAGYQTALFGKLHVSSIDYEVTRRHPNDGFDVYEPCLEGCLRMDAPYQAYAKWLRENHPQFHRRLSRDGRALLHVPEEVHLSRWAADRTADFIQNRDDSRPFLAVMSIFDPHNPYQDYPESMAERVNAAKIPEPLVVAGEFQGKPADLEREHRSSYLGDFRDLSLEELHAMRLGYHASLAFADQEFGRVLDVLDTAGIADNTLVIFTSDHGDMLGDHQLLVKGAFFYDPCVRVPLLMRWPERFGGKRRVDGLVQCHDLAATVLRAAGLSERDVHEAAPDAHDLLPLAAGQADSVRDHAVCCYRNSGLSTEPSRTPYWDPPIHATMFRDQRYKLNVWHNARNDAPPAGGELYDMDKDPQELHNLWADPEHAGVRQALTERLLDWLAAQERRLGSRGGQWLPRPTGKTARK